MARSLLERIWFTCSHQFSWPRRADDGGYYQVCLQCGVRYAYDWSKMRRGARLEGDAAAISGPEKRPHPKREPARAWHPRERRLKLHTPVVYRPEGASEWLRGMTENISRSGLLLQIEQELELDVALEFAFDMPAEICGPPGSRVLCRGITARVEPTKDGKGFLVATTIADYEFVKSEKIVEFMGHRAIRRRAPVR